MKGAVIAIAFVVCVTFALWFTVLICGPHISTKEVQEACKGHRGVAQFVTPTIEVPVRKTRHPFVICKDGAVSAVGS